MPQQSVKIQGMHCRSCELLLEDDLGQLPGVTRVTANFKKGEAIIVSDGTGPDTSTIEQVVMKAGYRLGVNPSSLSWFAQDMSAYGRLLFALGGVLLVFLLARGTDWFTASSIGNINVKELPLVFLVGLTAGVSTCAALVGGLVLALSARYSALHPELSHRQKLIPHFWFHVGRVGGFFVLGSLLGFLGEWLSGSIVFTAMLTLLAGGVMLVFGLQLSELFPRLSGWTLTLPKSLSRLLGTGQHMIETYSHRGAVVGGVLTFFLPCGFTQAVQLAVIALGTPLFGGIIMAVFALGTIPGLLTLGGLATFLSGRARLWLNPVIAIVLIAFGVWNLSNGLQLFGVSVPTTVTPKVVEEVNVAPIENGVQVIRMIQDETGYHPTPLPTLQAGIPARLIIDSQNSYTCAASLVIPAFGIKEQLEPGENIIEFTPTESGRLPFSCSMGMFRGALEVQ